MFATDEVRSVEAPGIQNPGRLLHPDLGAHFTSITEYYPVDNRLQSRHNVF